MKRFTMVISSLLMFLVILSISCGKDKKSPTEPSGTTYTISGTILENGAGFFGVDVTLKGTDTDETVLSSDDGSYSFTVAEGGNYTVTPSKTGYTFTPASQTFNNVTSNKTQDFTAEKKGTISISLPIPDDRLDQLEVRVLKSDLSQIASETFIPLDGYFKVTIQVKAQNNLKVLCIGIDNGVIERFGIDKDVDVEAGKTAEAIITGWNYSYIPQITSISPNPSTDGSYTVTWNNVPNATSYELQEADNDRFDGASTAYSGTDLKQSFSGMPSGTYYYRVRASNEYNVTSGWSVHQYVEVNTILQVKIAFVSNRDGNMEIYVMDADGSNQTRLTNNSAYDEEPSWSPDGSGIAFTSYRDGNHEIYVMDADGSNQTRLTDNSTEDYLPSWSPDGTKIAFTSWRDGNSEIYVMDADGSNQTRLTDNPAYDFSPSWSPDGSGIAFTSYRDGNHEIYVMDADGSNQTNLTNNSAGDYWPSWSPDGFQIAFSSVRDGNDEIYVMDADGSNQTNLTNNSAGNLAPSWSPDGSQIAFHSYRDGNYDIYVMDADGSNQTRLTDNSAIDYDPSWLPF